MDGEADDIQALRRHPSVSNLIVLELSRLVVMDLRAISPRERGC